MILSKEERDQFEIAAKPLIEFLCSLPHPHVHVLVNPTGAELVEGIAAIKCEDFIRD